MGPEQPQVEGSDLIRLKNAPAKNTMPGFRKCLKDNSDFRAKVLRRWRRHHAEAWVPETEGREDFRCKFFIGGMSRKVKIVLTGTRGNCPAGTFGVAPGNRLPPLLASSGPWLWRRRIRSHFVPRWRWWVSPGSRYNMLGFWIGPPPPLVYKREYGPRRPREEEKQLIFNLIEVYLQKQQQFYK